MSFYLLTMTTWKHAAAPWSIHPSFSRHHVTTIKVVRHRPLAFKPVILSEAFALLANAESKDPYLAMPSARQHRYSVYILGSLSGTLYIGITSDLMLRVRQHKHHSFEGFTAQYQVDRLLYFETYGDVTNAIRREKQLKGWRREKKLKLIESTNPERKDLSSRWYDKPVRATFQG